MKKSNVLFVVDYDGTLAPENSPADPRVIEDLSRLKSTHSFKLVLATARPEADAWRFIKRVDVFDALILELGSVIYFTAESPTLKGGEGVSSRELVIFKPGGWEELIDIVSREVPPVNKGEVLYYFDQDWLARAEKVATGVSTALLEIKKVGSRTYVFAPRGLDKGVGLSRLLRLARWKHRVVAIGDSASDLPLFELASIRVAVANADESLKRSADYVTSGERGEGVIEAVKKLI
ncbi:HAD hydrolase family protein [Infirmifilum lucidum]|uniref:HAD hydrolase family protein n=1 Tax=Infirmifilum lucidum TaxID=2776706 RepID=A0A7L9FHV1_9CREN|nr:HAD hydrolase family protein [Infirmifilum lucidum]QOJ79231.1 HAD hydrolase family protein [Infirmifilum lucidum]